MSRSKKLNLPLLVLAAALSIGARGCARAPFADTSAHASESGDKTIQFQGGGAVSQKGYLFIQKREGTPASEVIKLIVPKTLCKKESCGKFQFFRKDGSVGYGAGIPRGTTEVSIKLSDILGHSGDVSASEEGEYSAIVQMVYVGQDGGDYAVIQNGFVRLNILSKDYAPVKCADPSIAWRVYAGDDCQAQFTTAGRSVACGEGCLK